MTRSKRLVTFAFVSVAALLRSTLPAPAQAVTQWSQFLGNPQHTSYSSDSALSTSNAPQLGVKWMANLFSSDLGSPVVAYNDSLKKTVVYVGDERGDIYAVDASNGQPLWSTNLGLGDAFRATPAVAPDGSVWVGTNFNATLYKLDGATGNVLCSRKSLNGKAIMGSPMIVAPQGGSESVFWDSIDNGVNGPVVGTNESTCSQSFATSIASGSWTTPAYGVDRAGEPIVVAGSADPASTVTAMDALTGKVVWSFQTYFPPTTGGWDIGDAATISPPGTNGFSDGVAYVNNEYGYEYALDLQTGATLWYYPVYAASFGGKRYIVSSAALDGNQLVFGYFNGLMSLNATTGAKLWNWNASSGIDSSPAIVGPSGGEIVAFADLSGAFRVFSLGAGSQLYSYQTGSYISASPAENAGTLYITSADGFLYAFAPGGGNGGKPTETIASPSNGVTVANPNGSLTISGTAADGSSVSAVEIAVQSGGSSGLWYNASNNSWNSAPVRNRATLSNAGAQNTNWTFALPVPANGGNYEVFANAVNGSNIVDKGSVSYVIVSPSMNEPTIHVSTYEAPPASTIHATGNAFKPGETVTFTLLGNVVATAIVGATGNVPRTAIQIPSTAPFGPTSLTVTGNTSGKATSTPVFISNQWMQLGYSALRGAQEPHDDVIAHTIFVGASVLNVDWEYSSGAAIATSPAIVHGVAYFGNDSGKLSAVRVSSGSPVWTYQISSAAPIRSSPAVDENGNVIFGANDGTLYELTSSGSLAGTASIGGNLGAPAYANGTIVVPSSNGSITSLANPGLAKNWTVNAGAPIAAPIAYDAKNGVIIAGTTNGSVVAFTASGTPKWQAATGGAIGGITISSTKVVYAASGDGNVYAYDESTGAMKFKVAGDGTAVDALVTNGNGPAFGTAGGTMFDVNATGGIYYQRSYGKIGIVGMAGAGTDEFGATSAGTLELMRISDGGWHDAVGGSFAAPPVILDGMLFAGAGDGNLYAFTPQGYSPPPQTSTRVGTMIVSVNGGCTP